MPNGHQPRRGPVSMNGVIEKTLCGIEKAQRDYKAWSNGSWLWEAPEYMLTMYIAKELWKMPGSKYLTLEPNVRRTVKDAGGIGRGRVSRDIRQDGKFDIVLYWKRGTPRAIIEVKNQVDSGSKIWPDVDRIIAMLRNRDNSFQCGLIAFYTSKLDKGSHGGRVRSTLARIEKYARDKLGEQYLLSRYDSGTKVDGDSAWVASVLRIQRA